MSTYFVVAIIVLLCALVCYAFTSQSIEKKRLQRQRLLMALKTKQRNFVHMINGFPPNFLTNELITLVYRALIETSEQLSKLELKQSTHVDDVTLYTAQLNALPKTNPSQRVRIDNPQQLKEIRQHLQELQRLVVLQEALKAITLEQAQAYVDQIKRLSIQMSVDAYVHQAKQAQQSEKPRLAIHYFTLAKKLLSAENTSRMFDKQLAQLDNALKLLEEKAASTDEKDAASPATRPANEEVNKEWESFNKKEEDWKKKNVYD